MHPLFHLNYGIKHLTSLNRCRAQSLPSTSSDNSISHLLVPILALIGLGAIHWRRKRGAAMLEAERIARDPSVKGFQDLDELFAELKK